MDWATIISIVGQFLTLVTVILVFLTLREMQNQRKVSQKPDLVLPESKVYGYVYRTPLDEDPISLFMVTHWSDKELEEVPYNYVWSPVDAVKLYNVGFGVAKNIELIWTVNYDKTIQQIQDYCYENSLPIILKREEDALVINGVKIPTPSLFYYPLPPLQKRKHDFLLPASITSVGFVSHLPSAIIELISILLYLKGHPAREADGMIETIFATRPEFDFPSMMLEVHYDDLENYHYSKKFDVSFLVLSSLQGGGEDKKGWINLASGSFKFKNIQ